MIENARVAKRDEQGFVPVAQNPHVAGVGPKKQTRVFFHIWPRETGRADGRAGNEQGYHARRGALGKSRRKGHHRKNSWWREGLTPKGGYKPRTKLGFSRSSASKCGA